MALGGNYDKERLKLDMAKIVEKETEIFGENPNKYYLFIVHNYGILKYKLCLTLNCRCVVTYVLTLF